MISLDKLVGVEHTAGAVCCFLCDSSRWDLKKRDYENEDENENDVMRMDPIAFAMGIAWAAPLRGLLMFYVPNPTACAVGYG